MPKLSNFRCQAQVGEDWCKKKALVNQLYCKEHYDSFNTLHEEVEEPSRIDLEEAVMIAADELGFEDLEYLIDLPTDTTEWLRETMDSMNDEDLIDLHKQIEDYKKKKATKEKTRMTRATKRILDLLIAMQGKPMTQLQFQAESLANKLIK